PLLEDANMMTHPPLLYTGFVGLTVPYAFAMAALIKGKLDEAWIVTTRRWTITAWFFLTMGNLVGAWWSYHVLGWGGYWAWDPMENAAFMPWLPTTAFLHSVQVQERHRMLKVWNLSLIIIAFSLTIFGTILIRSPCRSFSYWSFSWVSGPSSRGAKRHGTISNATFSGPRPGRWSFPGFCSGGRFETFCRSSVLPCCPSWS